MSFLSIAGIAWPIDPQVWTELPTESGGCAISRGPEIEPGNRLPWWPRKWWIFKWFEVPFFVRESYFEMGGSSTNNRLFALRQVPYKQKSHLRWTDFNLKKTVNYVCFLRKVHVGEMVWRKCFRDPKFWPEDETLAECGLLRDFCASCWTLFLCWLSWCSCKERYGITMLFLICIGNACLHYVMLHRLLRLFSRIIIYIVYIHDIYDYTWK